MPKSSKKRSSNVKTRSSKSKNKAPPPFFEPSPKHRKNAAMSTVTPSPKARPSSSSDTKKQKLSHDTPWLVHDKLLRGEEESSTFRLDTNWASEWAKNTAFKDELVHVLEDLLYDPIFQHPHHVKKHNDDLNKWRHYATTLSKYQTKTIKQVLKQHQFDLDLHKDLLATLRDEVNERRYGGKRFYLRALNCTLFDSFVRCHVPLPPLPYWDIEVPVGVSRKRLYLKQLSAWHAYKRRVFHVLKVVIDCPTEEEGSVKVSKVVPLKHRGDMVAMEEPCENEEGCMPFTEIVVRDKELVDEEGNLTDRPACGCRICKRGFKQLLQRMEETQEESLLKVDEPGMGNIFH